MPGMDKSNERTTSEVSGPPLDTVIVGAGRGCESVLDMLVGDALGPFRMHVVGVADVDADAPGIHRARELGIRIAADLSELLAIPNVRLVLELTGSDEVRDEIERRRPRHVRLIDHFAARLFWDLHQAEEAVVRQRTEMRERVEAERARIAQILGSIPDEIVVVDTDMVIQDANASYLRNNDVSLAEVRGLRCYEVEQGVRGECQVAVENCPYFRVQSEGEPVSVVRKHFDAAGEAHYAAIVGAPLRAPDGRVTGMIEMTRDITHRIRLEEELAATEVRLRQLLERAPFAAWVKNRAGQYLDANPAACALLGKTAGDLVGRTDREIFPRRVADELTTGDRRVWTVKEPVSVQTEVDLGDRRAFLSTTKFPILDASGVPISLCGLAEDVTPQTEAEAELVETREYLQNILDNSPVLIITTDVEGKIASFSRGAERALGYEAAEVVGKPAALFYRDPEEREALLRRIEVDTAVHDYSCELLAKDGSAVPASVTLSQLKDSDGNLIGTVGISKDVSHRRALMRQVLQSERMAAVGRLAAGVAHEINNPLAVISEIAGFLLDLAGEEPQAPELLDELRDGLPRVVRHVRRGREITRRLLSFARKTEARIEAADVNVALDEILPFLEKEARLGNVQLLRERASDLPRVAMDEVQLQEVFINLITNATQAVSADGGGSIWVTAEARGGKVVATVRDDGPGIDEKVRDRLFDPFVTTKPTGEGTGLGLSICYAIVRRYDGEIRVQSSPGEGATFEVVLPALRGQRVEPEA